MIVCLAMRAPAMWVLWVLLHARILPCVNETHSAVASESRSTSIEDVARGMMSDGLPNRMPSPIAESLGLEPNTPVHHAEVAESQATDRLYHALSVLVELSSTTPRRPLRPLGAVFLAYREHGRRSDHFYYRATLDGELQRAVHIDGQVDAKGRAVKSSGTIKQQDIASPSVKDSFRHELDVWLKRRYVKRQWRAAKFSGGALKKSGEP